MYSFNITVCGCGNGAHACAALLSSKGYIVNIYSPLVSEIDNFRKAYHDGGGLSLYANEKFENSLKLNSITSNPQEVIPSSSLIIVIVPAFAHRNIISNIKKYIPKSCKVIFIPSRGGLEFEINLLMQGVEVVAFQTLPWACRTLKFGSSVEIKGSKDVMQASTIAREFSQETLKLIEELFSLKIDVVKSMITLTLSNIGQIFHPGIMYGLFKNDPFVYFEDDDIPLFYQSVNEEIAGILNAISEEIHEVAYKLSIINQDVEYDKVLCIEDWLKNSYGSLIKDNSSLERMFCSNEAYQGLKVPVVKLNNGLNAPDYKCRYIREDVPYGLLVTKSLADLVDVEVPMINEVIDNLGGWTGYDYIGSLNNARRLCDKSRLPVFYGINTVSELRNYGGIQ